MIWGGGQWKGRRDFARLKFWHKILSLPDDRLLKKVYQICKVSTASVRSSWGYATRQLLEELNLVHIWTSELTGSRSEWLALIKDCIRGREIKIWKAGLEEKDKLRVYRSFKADLKREEYLSFPSDQRSLLATIRSGTSSLRVETGRWRKEALEERICSLCGTGAVEDEAHFMVACVIYREERFRMIEGIHKLTGVDFAIMLNDPGWVVDAALGGIGIKRTRQIISSRFIRAALAKRAN